MKTYELIATTTFGVEAVVKRELVHLGFEVTRTENGKVTFLSDLSGIARANIWLRAADRVLLKVGEFKAVTFDELFAQTYALDWGDLIAEDGQFTVNGKSVKSTLFSISDCQALVKKAIVRKLGEKYHVSWFPETGAEFTVLVSLLEDVATLTIDTSGVALHKRGYRQKAVTAPLKETLAAAMIELSYWSPTRTLYDVFCGSGTIPIEAALIGRNIAPGLSRDFASRRWDWIGEAIWDEELRLAREAVDSDTPLKIFASDIDPDNLEAARQNAKAAGVEDCITFSVSDYREVNYDEEYGILITNPPYGERIPETSQIQKIYADMRGVFGNLDRWSLYILTSYEGFAHVMKRKPDRERKLFNGNIEVIYYQYYGSKPPLK
jgi:putative N6-adenine-specific DNA methylase